MEDDPDGFVPVADLGVQTQDAEQVDVALDGCGDLVEVDAAGGGDVGQAAHEAGAQRVEQQLGRGRSVVGADEHRRVVGADHGLALVEVLLAGSIEATDGALVVGAAHPAVGGAELEARDLRLGADGVERGEQRLDVDTVAAQGGPGDGHGGASLVGGSGGSDRRAVGWWE